MAFPCGKKVREWHSPTFSLNLSTDNNNMAHQMVGPHVNAQKTAVIYDRGKYVREKKQREEGGHIMKHRDTPKQKCPQQLLKL